MRFKGLLCGGSCGSAFYHALEIAKTMDEGTRVVCILPDSVRNYMTKHLMDEWMWERDLFTPEFRFEFISNSKLKTRFSDN